MTTKAPEKNKKDHSWVILAILVFIVIFSIYYIGKNKGYFGAFIRQEYHYQTFSTEIWIDGFIVMSWEDSLEVNKIRKEERYKMAEEFIIILDK